MERYKDDGSGITVKSMKFWHDNRSLIGNIDYVEAGFEPLLAGENEEGFPIDYNVCIKGEKGLIYLSGCNSGYGGEGPNGTREILEELNVPLDLARRLIGEKHFIVFIGEGEHYVGF